MNPFSVPPQSWAEVLHYFSLTPGSKELFKEFQRQSTNGRIQISTYPAEIRKKLAEASPALPLGAVFVTDGAKGKIYLDFQSPLGLFLPFVLHETVHSLDENLWRGARASLSRHQRRILIFDAECRAFRAQHAFQAELGKVYPEFQAFCQSQYPDIPFLNRELQPFEIAEMVQDLLA